MESIQISKKSSKASLAKKILTLIIFLHGSFLGFSQSTVANDTTVNEATKGVFAQLKTELNASGSNLTTILIIVGVLSIVGVAMYISFKEPEKTIPKK